MKIVHTSDWHIGRYLQGVSLLADQEHVLRQLVDYLRAERPDAMIIAGDLYDKAIVNVESMRLLDEVLSEITLGLNIPVVVIPGNHDNPGRMGIGARLFEHQKLYIRSDLPDVFNPIVFANAHGASVQIYTIPYYDVPYYREFLGAPECQTHNDILQELFSRMKLSGNNNIAVVHHTMSGSVLRSDSERHLVIGGVEDIEKDLFNDFAYVAMGHFHIPQFVEEPKINYSGSILKYSFDDIHPKSFSVVTFNEHGLQSVERVPLFPKRNLRVLAGCFEEIILQAQDDKSSDDFIEVKLVDKDIILYPMERLRKVYPNILKIRNDQVLLDAESSFEKPKIGEINNINTINMIELFYKNVIEQELSTEEKQELIDIIREIEQEEHNL